MFKESCHRLNCKLNVPKIQAEPERMSCMEHRRMLNDMGMGAAGAATRPHFTCPTPPCN